MHRHAGLQSFAARSVPVAAGVGLRAEHYSAVLDERPPVAWFEVHPENYFVPGGEPLRVLEAVRADYPLSLHGVGLSIGSADPLDQDHLRRLKQLIDRFQPGLVSEHLSWRSVDGIHFNDLLPLPYSEEALDHLAVRVDMVQQFLGRRILLENPSTYLQFVDSVIPEQEFLVELSRRSGCGILLDVNNVYVQARNHGFDAGAYLDAIPAELIGEIHLAGHTERELVETTVLIDTHDGPVCAAVWTLYDRLIQRAGPRPTLIEWDSAMPPLPALVAEANRAQRIMEAPDVQLA